MRIGFNPNKDKLQSILEYTHQVIIPVYIPNEEGYFFDPSNDKVYRNPTFYEMPEGVKHM